MHVTDIIENLDLGEYGQDFVDNYELEDVGSFYIDDIISEFADSRASSYYGDIADFAKDHFDDISETINEFGWDGVGKDLYRAAQIAEVMLIEEDIRDHEVDILEYMGYSYASSVLDSEEIPDEVVDAINEVCEDYPDRFWNISDAVDKITKESDEEE